MTEPSGIRRKVDDLGRIVIPAAVRKALGIGVGDELEVRLEGRSVIMSRPEDRCAFCEAETGLVTFRGQAVCWSCTAALRALDREHRGEAPPRFG